MVKRGNLQILPNYSIMEMASMIIDRDGYRRGSSAYGLTLLTKILFGKNLSNENFTVFLYLAYLLDFAIL
jgi:hypothetical protein